MPNRACRAFVARTEWMRKEMRIDLGLILPVYFEQHRARRDASVEKWQDFSTAVLDRLEPSLETSGWSYLRARKIASAIA